MLSSIAPNSIIPTKVVLFVHAEAQREAGGAADRQGPDGARSRAAQVGEPVVDPGALQQPLSLTLRARCTGGARARRHAVGAEEEQR